MLFSKIFIRADRQPRFFSNTFLERGEYKLQESVIKSTEFCENKKEIINWENKKEICVTGQYN